jgi:hypothetical protein
VSMPFFVNSYNVIGLLSGVAEDRTELNTWESEPTVVRTSCGDISEQNSRCTSELFVIYFRKSSGVWWANKANEDGRFTVWTAWDGVLVSFTHSRITLKLKFISCSRITTKLKFISCSRITTKLAAKTMVPGQGMSRTWRITKYCRARKGDKRRMRNWSY